MSDSTSPTEKIPILLIDDDEDEFVLTRDILEDLKDCPYELEWCGDYSSGLAALEEGRHAIYLIDYRMGEHTGIDLLEACRSAGHQRPSIMLTGMGDAAVDRAAMEAGAMDYLVKGNLTPDNLDRSLRYALARAGSEQELRRQAFILENVHDAVFLTAEDGTILSWNPSSEEVFGFSKEEIVGKNVSSLGRESEFWNIETISTKTSEQDDLEFTAVTSRMDGTEITAEVRVSRLQTEPSGFVFCASDVSDRMELKRRLLEAAEGEQRRIGQDIHDDLCQQLAGIGCLAKVLEGQIASRHQESAEGLAQIVGLVGEANTRARQLARGLVPAALDSKGIAAALGELAQNSETLFATPCFVTAPENFPELHEDTALQFYRIAQEAISNAVKHGKAKHIHLRLSRLDDERISLEVEDDGTGFDSEQPAEGLGILGMKQRAEAIGATLEIASAPSSTQIRCVARPRPRS